ncbi:MAG TPA: hypothetical protein VF499_12530 [Afipia sp.]
MLNDAVALYRRRPDHVVALVSDLEAHFVELVVLAAEALMKRGQEANVLKLVRLGVRVVPNRRHRAREKVDARRREVILADGGGAVRVGL